MHNVERLHSYIALSDEMLLLTGEGVPASEQSQQESKPQRFNLFQDEQLNSFFRRLAWSPDGLLPSQLLSAQVLSAFLLIGHPTTLQTYVLSDILLRPNLSNGDNTHAFCFPANVNRSNAADT